MSLSDRELSDIGLTPMDRYNVQQAVLASVIASCAVLIKLLQLPWLNLWSVCWRPNAGYRRGSQLFGDSAAIWSSNNP